MPPDSPDPWLWLDKAEQDRSAAGRLFTPGCLEFGVVAFLRQQAVEKLLKAYLVSRGVEPERTHDLGSLALRCAALDPGIRSLAKLVAPLTIFAVTHRYPGPPDPTREQVQTAMDVLEQVRDAVLPRLPPKPA